MNAPSPGDAGLSFVGRMLITGALGGVAVGAAVGAVLGRSWGAAVGMVVGMVVGAVSQGADAALILTVGWHGPQAGRVMAVVMSVLWAVGVTIAICVWLEVSAGHSLAASVVRGFTTLVIAWRAVTWCLAPLEMRADRRAQVQV